MGCIMRVGNYLWLVFLSLISVNAFAANYYYKVRDGGPYGLTSQYSSATSACSAWETTMQGIFGPDWTVKSHIEQTDTVGSYSCTTVRTRGSDTTNNNTMIDRYGDSCPTDTTLNAATGECEGKTNKCSALAGQSVPFSKSGTAPDGYMSLSGKISAPSQAACYSGCAVSTVDQKCTTKVKGSYFCRGSAVYSGEECPSGTVSPTVDTSSSATYPDAQTTNTSEPCVYKSDGKGGYTCSSSKVTESEGQNCGTVNGKTICVDKLPTSQTNKIDTQVNTTSNSDGSSTTNKTDVSTVTTCSGINSCSSTSTTTNTTTNKDAAGNKTSETSSSTGTGSTNGVAKDGSGEGESEEGGYTAQDWYKEGDDTYKSVMSDFSNKVQSLPIRQASTQFFTYNPSGNCPVYNFNVWFVKASFDGFCSNAIPWAAIRAVILATAAFFAFRIALLD